MVDDEPHIGLVLRPFLEQLGYRVSFARTLHEARSALRATPATDGLLLDLHLPDGSTSKFSPIRTAVIAGSNPGSRAAEP